MVTSSAQKKVGAEPVTFAPPQENHADNRHSAKHWDAWMLAALEGDQRAYKELLTAIQPWLASFFRKRIAIDKVEDLMQDTLLSIHHKRHTYDPTYPFGVWLAAVARHRLIDYYRLRARQLTQALPEDDQLAAPVSDASIRYDIERLLASLPAKQAAVVRQLKLEQQHVADVAKALNMSETAVKVTLHRSVKKLTALIDTV